MWLALAMVLIAASILWFHELRRWLIHPGLRSFLTLSLVVLIDVVLWTMAFHAAIPSILWSGALTIACCIVLSGVWVFVVTGKSN